LLTEPSFSSGLVGNPLISNQSISQARTTELARSVEELRALGAVSQAVGSTLDLPVVLDTIVAKATQISGTEAGAIYVLDERQREFQLRATYGMSEELIAAVRNMHAEISEAVGLLTETHKPSQQADLRDLPSTPANDTIQGLRLRSDHLNSVGQYLQNVCFAVLVLNSYVVRSSLPLPSWNSPGRIAAAVRTQVFVILVQISRTRMVTSPAEPLAQRAFHPTARSGLPRLAPLRSRLAPAPQSCPGEKHRDRNAGTLRLIAIT
jgi:hypothetical protein